MPAPTTMTLPGGDTAVPSRSRTLRSAEEGLAPFDEGLHPFFLVVAVEGESEITAFEF